MTRGRQWQIVIAQAILFGIGKAHALAAEPAAAAPQSFKQIQSFYDEKLEQSRKEIETQRLAALQQFLPKAPEADREPVLGTMVELAFGLDQYDRAVTLADDFIKQFSKSEDLSTVRKLRLASLARSNKLDQARKDWTAFLGEHKPEHISDVLDAGIQLAEAFADSGDVKSARAVYADLRDKLPNAIPDAPQRAQWSEQLEQQLVGPRLELLEWVGKTPPELRGKTLDGKPVDLNAYKGKVVLLDFWATWCGPCIASLPHLMEAYQKHHDKGFEVIGISLDASQDDLKQFIQRQKLAWPQLWDNQESANPQQNPFSGPNTRRYSLSAIPATFLIDRDGKIARAGVSGQALDQAVTRLLAKPMSQPASGATGR